MPEPSYVTAAARLKALAHPARLQMLDLLRGGELCVCHLERALGKRQAYVSQQLMVLREAGLVAARKEGLSVYYRISDETLYRQLDAVLGPPMESRPVTIADCPCPLCSPMSVHTHV